MLESMVFHLLSHKRCLGIIVKTARAAILKSKRQPSVDSHKTKTYSSLEEGMTMLTVESTAVKTGPGWKASTGIETQQ